MFSSGPPAAADPPTSPTSHNPKKAKKQKSPLNPRRKLQVLAIGKAKAADPLQPLAPPAQRSSLAAASSSKGPAAPTPAPTRAATANPMSGMPATAAPPSPGVLSLSPSAAISSARLVMPPAAVLHAASYLPRAPASRPLQRSHDSVTLSGFLPAYSQASKATFTSGAFYYKGLAAESAASSSSDEQISGAFYYGRKGGSVGNHFESGFEDEQHAGSDAQSELRPGDEQDDLAIEHSEIAGGSESDEADPQSEVSIYNSWESWAGEFVGVVEKRRDAWDLKQGEPLEESKQLEGDPIKSTSKTHTRLRSQSLF